MNKIKVQFAKRLEKKTIKSVILPTSGLWTKSWTTNCCERRRYDKMLFRMLRFSNWTTSHIVSIKHILTIPFGSIEQKRNWFADGSFFLYFLPRFPSDKSKIKETIKRKRIKLLSVYLIWRTFSNAECSAIYWYTCKYSLCFWNGAFNLRSIYGTVVTVSRSF